MPQQNDKHTTNEQGEFAQLQNGGQGFIAVHFDHDAPIGARDRLHVRQHGLSPVVQPFGADVLPLGSEAFHPGGCRWLMCQRQLPF